ncbi:di-heme oxidoredictase family protein [Microbulbifer sp. 2304DJ12-6]|uniref:di-heme oxidoredictase family protein n=1 Tax=Microbulbifer sp. 2304DJ12-6 TaxID=3233340 RepID=UPI0039AFAE15
MRIKQLVLLLLCTAFTPLTFAQLLDKTLVNQNNAINAPGGTIEKSLLQQIGTGQGADNIPGSSIYLIKRDPARSIRRGRQLFQRKFSMTEGLGPRVNASSSGDVTAMRALGAGLTDSCAACHGRPRGAAGFGGDVATRPDSRDAPHLFGLGLVEQLGDEMTSELRATRANAIDEAMNGIPGQIFIEEDFEAGSGEFQFVEDPFGTNQPAYSSGQLISDSGDIRAVTTLGGIDNLSITEMSGGWQTSFTLTQAAEVTFDFDFRVIQTSEYESDEISSAIIAIDGQETVLATLRGNGNGGGDMSTGIQTTTLTRNLSAGHHTVVLGGFNNKKTANDEITFISYGRATVSIPGQGPGTVIKNLLAKGVDFGTITAFSDGSLDTSDVQGVNEDLRIRPFFAQGGTVTIREFAIGAFKDEMGLQAVDPILCAVTDSNNPQALVSPAGFHFDPDQDTFERPPTCSISDDPDGDGKTNEIDAALIDHLEFYLLNYFKPGQYRLTSRSQFGYELMETIGCTGCHVEQLTINADRRVADVETQYDPFNAIFNDLFATASTRFIAVDDGDTYPLLLPKEEPFVVKNFFSDLKRHDLGPAFHEREYDGTLVTHFMTEPLWGVGSSSPYGHDGRSINLDQVIRRHGGEAAQSRNAYVALSDDEQAQLREFLQTLVLFPPDDTASNLNPGNPGTNNPQDPAEHGSINLGALFQIPDEGSE